MTNTKTFFSKAEAFEDIINTLENGCGGYYCDLHNEVFNSDYYLIYTNDCEKALEQFGVFRAVGIVKDYELDNFGELYTDLSDPFKLANMLYYIIGDSAISDLCDCDTFNDNFNEWATEENNKIIVDYIKSELL